MPLDIDRWAAQIAEQPSWSEMFFILLTVPGQRSRKRMLAQQPLGNMVLLERPVRPRHLSAQSRPRSAAAGANMR